MTEGWAGSSITPHQFHWWSTKHFLKTLRNFSMLPFGKIWACLYNHCLFTSHLHSLLFPLLHWNWFLEVLKWSSFAQIQCIFINSISSWPVSSVQSLSHVLCDPMDCSMPGSPVHHQLPELAQTHPLSQWCHPAISSSVVPFTSCSFPASGSFPMSQFASGRQRIGASASASVLPMNTQNWGFLLTLFQNMLIH